MAGGKSAREPEEVLRERVRRYRDAQGWSQLELANRVSESGVTMHQTTVAKIEGAVRKVTVGELFALAAALNVPPVALVLPLEEPGNVAVNPATSVSVWDALEWIAGSRPLPQTETVAWRRATEALRAYRRVKDAESDAAESRVHSVKLRDLGADADARRYEAAYMRGLSKLGNELDRMRELGYSTKGVVSQALLDDLDYYGGPDDAARQALRIVREED